MKKIKYALTELIVNARLLGLGETDVNNAQEFMNYNEFELSFDTLITQMYEFNIAINDGFYDLTVQIADSLKLPSESYSFMKELIKSNAE